MVLLISKAPFTLDEFNQKVDLPSNLTHLTFGHKFDDFKIDLPINLKYLQLLQLFLAAKFPISFQLLKL